MRLSAAQQKRLDALLAACVAADSNWDESKHRRGKDGRFSKQGSQSAMKSVQANIARGRQAMNTAIAEKRTVHRAMYHNELGWIDFEWGSEGRLKNNGKTKGAMGISHIIEARMRKDRMTYRQVVEMLTDRVTETVAKGKIVGKAELGNVCRLKLDYLQTRVSMSKSKGSNAWIITAFDLF